MAKKSAKTTPKMPMTTGQMNAMMGTKQAPVMTGKPAKKKNK